MAALNKTAQGNKFRDCVAELFRTKYDDVRTEEEVGGVHVDVTYRDCVFGKWETIGIECKHHDRSLGAQYISSSIWNQYSPLITKGLLQYVIVVTLRPIGPTAQKRLDTMPGLRFRTYAELEEDLLGLRRYFEKLSHLFSADGLSTYYVDARFKGHVEMATNYIERWINAADSPPLAVLGNYGEGKTTLAKRVVADQAKKYLRNPTQRMPILIRLGETVHETTLEGLFGREFTSRNPAQNFHFDTLWHLNNQGRLLVVLDGFDEMKHGMTVTDYKANFQQFNRLATPKSRVLLLGRPTSLPSELRVHVLRGRRIVDDVPITAPSRRAWDEVSISLFTEAEVRAFLAQYLKYLITNATKGMRVLRKDSIPARVEEIIAKVRLDILCRPVHAKIIAELGFDPLFNVAGITEYTLYDEFLKQIIERDALEKPARRPLKIDDRKTFQEDLAYWAWTRRGHTRGLFLRDEVPSYLVEGLDDGGTVDIEAKLNEYLVSTVTEEKEAGQLIFGHRSFQEFLVAQKLRRFTQYETPHAELSRAVQPEVVKFLLAGPSLDFLEKWFGSLPGSGNPVSLLYFSLFAHNEAVLRQLRERIGLDKRKRRAREPSVEEVGILSMCFRVKNRVFTKDEVLSFLLQVVGNFHSVIVAEFAAYLLLRLAAKSEAPRLIIAVLRRFTGRKDYVYKARKGAVNILLPKEDPVCDFSLKCITYEGQGDRLTLEWDSKRTYQRLSEYLKQTGRFVLEDELEDEGSGPTLGLGRHRISTAQLIKVADKVEVKRLLLEGVIHYERV